MAVKIPQIRYITDLEPVLKKIKEEVRDLIELSKVQRRKLSASLSAPKVLEAAALGDDAIIRIRDSTTAESRSRARKFARKIDPELTKIVVPDMESLRRKYALSNELYEKYRTLDTIESQARAMFKGKRSENFLKETVKLKEEVGTALKETLTFLNELAHHHVPKSFERYMEAVSEEVDSHLVASKSELFLYVSVTGDGALAFTYYKMMENVVNEDGTTTPILYIVIQWVVGNDKRDPGVTVHLMHEFVTPTTVENTVGGVSASNAQDALRAINKLLVLENFATELGVVPMSLAFLKDPKLINKNLFSVQDLVTDLMVDGTSLTFKVKSAVPKSSYPELATQLSLEVRNLLKNQRGSRIRVNIEQGKREIRFTVVTIAGPLDITMQDAEFLKDQFGINDSQLRKIVHILNSES